MEPAAWDAAGEPVAWTVWDGPQQTGTVRREAVAPVESWTAGTAAYLSGRGGFGSAVEAGAWLLLGCPAGGLPRA
jgi:hypothetical protein